MTTREYVQQLRAQGWTQARIGDALGVSDRAVRQILSGSRPYNNLTGAAEAAARGRLVEARAIAHDNRRRDSAGRIVTGRGQPAVVRTPAGDLYRRRDGALYGRLRNMTPDERVRLRVRYAYVIDANGNRVDDVEVVIGGGKGISAGGLSKRGINTRTPGNAIDAAAIEYGVIEDGDAGASTGVSDVGPIVSVQAFFTA